MTIIVPYAYLIVIISKISAITTLSLKNCYSCEVFQI
jgi:hypothetical protein